VPRSVNTWLYVLAIVDVTRVNVTKRLCQNTDRVQKR
jgi:hypothetical protein